MASDAPPLNPLSAPAISKQMVASLSKGTSPQLKNAFDATALAAHATLLSVGFRLIGLGEDHRLDAPSDASNPQPLPSEWNAGGGNYSFKYKHSQSSMEFLLKVNRIANKAVVMGMGIGDDKTYSFDVTVRDYVSDGNLPATPAMEGRSEEEIQRSITDVFISAGRLSDFGSLMRINVVQKLIPNLQKPGYEETRDAQSSSSASQQRLPPTREPQPRNEPFRDDRHEPPRPNFPVQDPLVQPRRPMPEPIPGFEDEHGIMRPPRGGIPAGGMPRYGDRDLYPQGLGPRDPLYGGIGPGLGPQGGGGMYPSFDDPLFAGQGQGGAGYDPQAPPGSRYDPVGPGGARHPRGAGMGGRPPNNPFSGFGHGDFI